MYIKVGKRNNYEDYEKISCIPTANYSFKAICSALEFTGPPNGANKLTNYSSMKISYKISGTGINVSRDKIN